MNNMRFESEVWLSFPIIVAAVALGLSVIGFSWAVAHTGESDKLTSSQVHADKSPGTFKDGAIRKTSDLTMWVL